MIRCDAIKIAYRQSREGFVVSFALHPQEVPPELANAPIGSQWQLSLVPLNEDGNALERKVMPHPAEPQHNTTQPDPASAPGRANRSRGGGESRPARRTWTDDRRSPAMKREPAGARLSGIADKASSWRKQSEAGLAPGPRETSARRPWHELAPAQQAGILCKDVSFRQFLERMQGDDTTTDHAHADLALMVRQICGVESRADIRPGTPAAEKWRRLVSDYRGWIKEAEIVG